MGHSLPQETLSGVDFMDMSSVPYPEHQRPLVDMADNSFFDGCASPGGCAAPAAALRRLQSRARPTARVCAPVLHLVSHLRCARRYKIKAYVLYVAPYAEVRARPLKHASAHPVPEPPRTPAAGGRQLPLAVPLTGRCSSLATLPRTASLPSPCQVLVLDSDAIPLMDPAVMFDTDQYRSHGNLFFPDRGVPICTRPDLFEELGVPPPDDRNDGRLRQTEAGMFAFHR